MAAQLDSECIFCKIISGQIPSEKLIETEHCFAFMDINPLADGHCLVVPKYHAAKLHELPDDYHADIGRLLGRLSRAVVDGTGCFDYNILQNNGSVPHQAVFHVHFHIIPKPSHQEGLDISWPAKAIDKTKLSKVRSEI